MIEIKYRGQDIENNGVWRYGSLVTYPNGQHVIIDFDKDGNELRWDVVNVGQNIGLKDKNGKEIYDGDFIKKDYPFEGVYLVKYDEVRLIWKFCMSENFWLLPNDFPVFDYEIIGNIHDNPELLEDVK